jgi:NADPH-dependent curcumin reductase CurA|tara:strand:- start:220 stop:1284 length:1065 start_codon:yes stop_codon:yes gene_type:complete
MSPKYNLEIVMPQESNTNRRVVLAQRPNGLPDENTLKVEATVLPQAGPGEMLLRTSYLSLDPYMRGRMNDTKSYAEPVKLGEVMTGQVVAQVVDTNCDGFEAGDYVLAGSGWQDYAVSDGVGIRNLGKSPENPSWFLGILGMPGYTAYAGLLKIGEPKPGETVVVAAASGPVGATVGQIAKLKGCRVVGIAGGPEKCAHVVENLGFDACIDHKADNFSDQLKAACPDGVDVYFENVGGRVLYAVLPLLNAFARMPVCGVVSWYNLTGLPDGPDFGPAIMGTILRMKVKVEGFIIFDSFPASLFKDFVRDMSGWLESGQVQYKEQVIDGLEHAPAALNDLLVGNCFGKMVVKVEQ